MLLRASSSEGKEGHRGLTRRVLLNSVHCHIPSLQRMVCCSERTRIHARQYTRCVWLLWMVIGLVCWFTTYKTERESDWGTIINISERGDERTGSVEELRQAWWRGGGRGRRDCEEEKCRQAGGEDKCGKDGVRNSSVTKCSRGLAILALNMCKNCFICLILLHWSYVLNSFTDVLVRFLSP